MTALTNNTRWFLLLLFGVAFAVIFLAANQFLGDWYQISVEALLDAALLTLSVWVGMLVIQSYPTKVGMVIYALLIGVAGGMLVWYASRWLLSLLFQENLAYVRWLQVTDLARLIISLLVNCWLITLTAVNRRSSVLEQQFKNISDATSLHREAELFKLRQQLQPHFLYNSLNSISALILIQPDKAQEMIGKLSDFLRNSVKREAREQIPVDEELEYIEAYLAIEGVRFGDRLKIVYKKDYTDSATIPPFLLQPILENAIKFGLYGRTGDVVIQLSISLRNAYLLIVIENPYDRADRPPTGTGFGLEGIQRRLFLLFGRTDLLETSATDTTFTTTLKIPQDHVQGLTDR